MPFALTRGVYGRPREGTGIGATLASTFYAVKPGSNTYSPVTQVWQWCSNRWDLVWTSEVAAIENFTVAYIPSGTRVGLSWVVPQPNIIESLVIKRSDGSVVATIQSNEVTTWSDPTPLPGSQTYTIQAFTGVTGGPIVSSNTILIDLTPATATATIINNNTIRVDWTANAAQGDPDQWWIYDGKNGGWIVTALPGTQHSYDVAIVAGTKNLVYGVYPYLSGYQAQGRNTNTIPGTPANNPAGFFAVAIPGRVFHFSWPHPENTVNSGFSIQHSTNLTTWSTHNAHEYTGVQSLSGTNINFTPNATAAESSSVYTVGNTYYFRIKTLGGYSTSSSADYSTAIGPYTVIA